MQSRYGNEACDVCVFFFYLDQSNLQSKQQKKRMSVFNEHCLQ